MSQDDRNQEEAGRILAVGLTILAGLYILSRIFTPKREVFSYYCPSCRHIVSERAPYCWYCRIRLQWQSSPIKAPLKRTSTFVFLGILVFLIIMRFAIYPFTGASPDTSEACERALWLFGGVFARDFGGYFGQTAKG